MRKLVMVLSALAVMGTLAGCDYLDSPERKAFEQFVAKCKADPTTEDCKAWAASSTEAGK